VEFVSFSRLNYVRRLSLDGSCSAFRVDTRYSSLCECCYGGFRCGLKSGDAVKHRWLK
jgi:hypothetical protein